MIGHHQPIGESGYLASGYSGSALDAASSQPSRPCFGRNGSGAKARPHALRVKKNPNGRPELDGHFP